jgi:hypothetical protein
MNKPTSMVINETRISLTDICNKSGLPACVLEPIVKELYEEIKYVSSMQLKQDTEAYNKAQEDAKLQMKKQETE